MGAYVYALQPPDTVRIVDLDGKPVVLGHIDFAYKRSGNWTGPGNASSAKVNAAMDREIVKPLRMAWRESKAPRPNFVTIGDNKSDVYTWPVRWITCIDDHTFGTNVVKVGHLHGTVLYLET